MGKDKLYHIIAGFGIALLIGLFNPIAGLIIACLVGAAKEVIWDMAMKKGTFEMLDFLATALGAIFGTGAALLIINYLF